MVSLNFSFKELLSYLRQNSKKWPKLLKDLSCEGNRLNLNIPRKDDKNGPLPPVPVDAVLECTGERFILIAGSGDIQRVASLVFTTDELARYLRNNAKKWPPFLDHLEYDHEQKQFRTLVEPRVKADAPDKKPAFELPIHLLAKLLSREDDEFRLRVTYE
jgi:hypothetical protein